MCHPASSTSPSFVLKSLIVNGNYLASILKWPNERRQCGDEGIPIGFYGNNAMMHAHVPLLAPERSR
jgi:hypothetical protein